MRDEDNNEGEEENATPICYGISVFLNINMLLIIYYLGFEYEVKEGFGSFDIMGWLMLLAIVFVASLVFHLVGLGRDEKRDSIVRMSWPITFIGAMLMLAISKIF